MIVFNDSYKISGDDLFRDAAGHPAIPEGTIRIRETKAPEGYMIEEESHTVHFSLQADGTVRSDQGDWNTVNHVEDLAVISEEVIEKYPAPSVRKKDAETKDGLPGSGRTFEGLEFTVYNRSEHAVLIDEKAYPKDSVILISEADASGQIAIGEKLPYGRYGIRETGANDCYLISDTSEIIFEVTEKEGVKAFSPSEIVFVDQPARGGLCFEKRDSEQNTALSGIPFRMTNVITGESHYLLTDGDGRFSTEKAPHTRNTNGNDGLFSSFSDTEIIPEEVMAKTDPDAGIFFGNGSASDDIYALPVGTYLLEEMKCEKNRAMSRIQETVVITENAVIKDLGILYDTPRSLRTMARDALTGSEYVSADAACTVIDRVCYENLTPGMRYTLSGTLMLKTSEGVVPAYDKEGQAVLSSLEFIPESASGETELTFAFDASGFEGRTAVAFEELHLSESGEFIAEHKDPEDEAQTVFFPEIRTEVKAADTGERITAAKITTELVDMVHYVGLKPGIEYRMYGRLVNKASGEPVMDGGKAVTAETVFTPEASEGETEVVFRFDASALSGTSITVFEYCYDADVLAASHEDPEDAAQTVLFPTLRTEATVQGKHEAIAEGKVEVEDRVEYENLIPGMTYTIKGKLVFKDNGEAICDDTGRPIEAGQTFVPEAADGSIVIRFLTDASAYGDRAVVAFEKLMLSDTVIASHEDSEDEAQTVFFIRKKSPVKVLGIDVDPKTRLIAAGGLLIVLIITVILALKKKKR